MLGRRKYQTPGESWSLRSVQPKPRRGPWKRLTAGRPYCDWRMRWPPKRRSGRVPVARQKGFGCGRFQRPKKNTRFTTTVPYRKERSSSLRCVMTRTLALPKVGSQVKVVSRAGGQRYPESSLWWGTPLADRVPAEPRRCAIPRPHDRVCVSAWASAIAEARRRCVGSKRRRTHAGAGDVSG